MSTVYRFIGVWQNVGAYILLSKQTVEPYLGRDSLNLFDGTATPKGDVYSTPFPPPLFLLCDGYKLILRYLQVKP